MKRTVLEKIVALKGMIFRLEHPELVIKEMKNIFEMIDHVEDTVIKEKALVALAKLSVDMMKEVDLDLLETLKDIDESKVVNVKIDVEQYLDVTVINIDRKIPYSQLSNVLNKVMNNFNKTEKHIDFLGYSKEDKCIFISYNENRYKDIFIKIKKWNLSDDVAEVYTEGFAEYLQK